MDVELFRLLLLIIGILFLLGIYFWDRHKRINDEVILNRRQVEKNSSAIKASEQKPASAPAADPLADWDDDEELDDDLYTPSGTHRAVNPPASHCPSQSPSSLAASPHRQAPVSVRSHAPAQAAQ
ncbi:MAG: hypothetical protein HQL47_09255, partial [Gammaproteobacteria bacterium]|nr:hypothetical protein [Gammaproteobacteria bacterium]